MRRKNTWILAYEKLGRENQYGFLGPTLMSARKRENRRTMGGDSEFLTGGIGDVKIENNVSDWRIT